MTCDLSIAAKNANGDSEFHEVPRGESMPDLIQSIFVCEGDDGHEERNTFGSIPMDDAELWAWLKSE